MIDVIVAVMMVLALLGVAVQRCASSAATGLLRGNSSVRIATDYFGFFLFCFSHCQFSFDVPPAPAQGAEKTKFWYVFALSESLLLETDAHCQVCC